MFGNSSFANVVPPSFGAQAPFADPFLDIASQAMPMSIPAMLRHAEYFAVSNETMREAFNRLASFFVTQVNVEGELGPDEKKKHKEYFSKQLLINDRLIESALNFLCYGNYYLSILHPIVRYLQCPKCSYETRCADAIDNPDFDFSWGPWFYGTCPGCKYSGQFKDRDDLDKSRPLIFKCWNPHDIRTEWNESNSEVVGFHWIIPADYRSEIKDAGFRNRSILTDTPRAHIEAALKDMNIYLSKDLVYHWHEPYLAGLRFRGVGVPRAIINYRQSYLYQVLRRMQESLGMGHVVPMRVISPANTAGKAAEEGDILKTMFLGDLQSRINQMVANHRLDPNTISYSPVPLAMAALGADARALIPADIMNQVMEVMLNGCGVPIEFYKMSMQVQAAPVGLRLMKQTHTHIVSGLNGILEHVGRRAQFLLSWEKATYTLIPVDIEDSIELQQLRLQAAAGGLAARSEALKTLHLDFEEQTRKKMEDVQTEQRIQAEAEQKSDAFSFSRQLSELTPMGGLGQAAGGPGGQPAQGQQGQPAQGQTPDQGQSGPMAPGTPGGSDPLAGIIPQPGQKIDPQELDQRAQAAAETLIRPEMASIKFQKLKEMRESNPQFHELVTAKMEKLRSKARSQGQQLILNGQAGQNGQAGGGGGGNFGR